MKVRSHSKSNTYSLAVRSRKRDGQWDEWRDKGQGDWIGLEHVQKQIMMLRKANSREIEIAFFKDGKYLDYNGNEIGKPIRYETK